MSIQLHVRLAVSTLVLAALAVPEVTACPLGRSIDLARPELPWQQGHETSFATSVARVPSIVVKHGTGDVAAVVRALGRLALHCGTARGEVMLRFVDGRASVATSGFEPRVAACVHEAIDGLRVRAGDATLVHGTLAL